MEAWIAFGRGPLFRIAFSLMLLGLLRSVVLTIVGVIEAYRRSEDGILNWREMRRQTLGWLFPVGRLWRQRPLYSSISVVFHAGLLIVPPFLAAHMLLWKRAVGFAWLAIPQRLADVLTTTVIAACVGLFCGRLCSPLSRGLSRKQDYFWPPLLAVPFVTGFFCSNVAIGPATYESCMLVHVYSADLIMVLIPFSKIAHCVLAPLSQLVTAVAWKFPAGAGDRVAATLGFGERPTWFKGSRLGIGRASVEEVLKK